MVHFISVFSSLTHLFIILQTFFSCTFQFDINTKYKSLPVMLEGGYEDWLSRYPTLTTNSLISPPKESINNKFLLGMFILLFYNLVACILMQSLCWSASNSLEGFLMREYNCTSNYGNSLCSLVLVVGVVLVKNVK